MSLTLPRNPEKATALAHNEGNIPTLDFEFMNKNVLLLLTNQFCGHPFYVPEIPRIEIMNKKKSTALYYIVFIHN